MVTTIGMARDRRATSSDGDTLLNPSEPRVSGNRAPPVSPK
jgi:hypothetical protein